MSYSYRLFIFSVLILMTLYFVWFSLKIYGENQPTTPYQTKLIKTLGELKSPILWKSIANAQASDNFIWLKANYENSSWVLSDTKTPLAIELHNNKEKFKFLFIDVNSPEALPQLRKTLKEKDWEKTILCSRADGILKDLRELEPEWSYCSGEIFLTRLLALSSIALGSLAPIRADIFFVHLNEIQISKNLMKVFTEAKRQNKLIFSGPITGPLEGYPIDHWLVQ